MVLDLKDLNRQIDKKLFRWFFTYLFLELIFNFTSDNPFLHYFKNISVFMFSTKVRYIKFNTFVSNVEFNKYKFLTKM